jgi:CTP synthase (UTP-ammonia lyase)
MPPARIFIIGERDEATRAHQGIEASFELHARLSGRRRPVAWISTAALDSRAASDELTGATGIWCAPGSPYASTRGALKAIHHARVSGVPFLGTCGGFQHALMEYASAVLQHRAAHAEMELAAESPLIAKLSCSLVEVKAKVLAKRGRPYETLIGRGESEEEFHCNYGVAARFQGLFDDTDMEFVAFDREGQPRVFWHRNHPFFVGSLFQPERKAFAGGLHPLVRAFIERT